jgi:hypothetical protein
MFFVSIRKLLSAEEKGDNRTTVIKSPVHFLRASELGWRGKGSIWPGWR